MKKICKRLYSLLLSVFLLPESIIAFFSGILVSAAINILTSFAVSKTIEVFPLNLILSSGFMLLAACSMMAWVVVVKPCQDKYYNIAKNERNWYEQIRNTSRHKLLILLLVFTVLFIGFGFYYLIG